MVFIYVDYSYLPTVPPPMFANIAEFKWSKNFSRKNTYA